MIFLAQLEKGISYLHSFNSKCVIEAYTRRRVSNIYVKHQYTARIHAMVTIWMEMFPFSCASWSSDTSCRVKFDLYQLNYTVIRINIYKDSYENLDKYTIRYGDEENTLLTRGNNLVIRKFQAKMMEMVIYMDNIIYKRAGILFRMINYIFL